MDNETTKSEKTTTGNSQRVKLPFSLLANTYQKVGNCRGENSKNQQKAHLSNLFKTLIRESPEDLVKGYWLSILKIGPDYEKNQLGVGKEILMKSIARSCGMTEKQVRDKNTQLGDFGQVAKISKNSQRSMDAFITKKKAKEPLTIEKVFSSFKRIANAKGNNSNSQKQSIIINLLQDSTGDETKFIVRWVEGNLKIAAAEKTMQKALISALFEELVDYNQQNEQNLQQYELIIKKATAEYPNDSQIILNLIKLKNDFRELANICKLTLGTPCRPMLAKPTRGITDILSRFEGKRFTCEYKYDGLRGQVHYNNGKIEIFSRNLQNLTSAYIDIVQQINKNLQKMKQESLTSFILDCEIVAINKNTKQLLPFQVLSTRSRKNATLSQIQVHVNLFAFDILYYNEPITHLPLQKRREYLLKMQSIFNNIIRLSEHKQSQDVDAIQQFLNEAIKFGTEGLMIKDLDSIYTCSKRAWEWVKLKKDYIDGLGDTIDVVPIGAEYGVGKRTGVYGSYLLATYNPDMEVYETLCKIGTGFSDQVLKSAYEQLKETVVVNCPREYKFINNSSLKMDVWFTPTTVWQIKGADFQLSPVHTCAIGDTNAGKGIGLRFPRLIGSRKDKKPIQASTNQFVYDLYKQQAVVQNKANDDEDDYY